MRLRRLNRVIAELGGYFWRPCPICGQMFGGHEHRDGFLNLSATEGLCTCPDCPGDHYADDYTGPFFLPVGRR